MTADEVDPYWQRLNEALGHPSMTAPGSDTVLMQRLQEQAADGRYVAPEVRTLDETLEVDGAVIATRVYLPLAPGGARPLLVWCHGGAFLGGDLDMPEADATAREICSRVGAVVVSVDYRLAQAGVHFPVPFNDALATYRWALEHADEWDVDLARVTVGGASAGANLAAGVCVALRDEEAPPARQLLLYPLVHPRLPTPSDELAIKLAGLSPAAAFAPEIVQPVVENYLGCPADEAPPYAMAGVADLHAMPPTLVINCEYDGLRASGELFAEQLEQAGSRVHVVTAADVLHGHINSPWLPQAQQSYAMMADWVGGAGS